LKPRTFKFEYEAESDDFFTTDSEPECVPKQVQGKAKDLPAKEQKVEEPEDSVSENSLGLKPRKFNFEYEDESNDFFTTDSETECVPKQVQGERKVLPAKEEKVKEPDDSVSENSLGLKPRKFNFEFEVESDDLVDSEPECVPKEVQGEAKVLPAKEEKFKEPDDSVSENSLGLKPRKFNFEYEVESDDLVATDSEPECFPKEVQGEAKVLPAKVEKVEEPNDYVSANSLGLKLFEPSERPATATEPECVPKEVQSEAKDALEEANVLDVPMPEGNQCEPKESQERDNAVVPDNSSRQNIATVGKSRGFDDDLKINIDFAYETESDEFSSTESKPEFENKDQNEKQSEDKKVEVSEHSASQKDDSVDDAKDEISLTDFEIDSIAEDNESDQQVCSNKERNDPCDSRTTKAKAMISKNSEDNNIQDYVKAVVESNGEIPKEKHSQVHKSDDSTSVSSVSLSYDGDESADESCSEHHTASGDQTGDSNGSFFGINVTKSSSSKKANTTERCDILEYVQGNIKPQDKIFKIDHKDSQDTSDGGYIENNSMHSGNEDMSNAIKEVVNAGYPKKETNSGDGDIQPEPNVNVEKIDSGEVRLVQKSRMFVGFEQPRYHTSGPSNKETKSGNGDNQPKTNVNHQNKDSGEIKLVQKSRMFVGFEQPRYHTSGPSKRGEAKKEIAKKKIKTESADEDSFMDELDELLSAAETDIEESSKKNQASAASEALKETASTVDAKYIPYKPPIAPKQHPKPKETEQRMLEPDQTKECFQKSNVTSKPDQTEEFPTTSDTQPDVFLRRNVRQMIEGVVSASNETGNETRKEGVSSASKSSGSQNTQPRGNAGSSETQAGGGRNGQGSSAGGPGDEDPDDPRKPKPRKEPEDKKDEDEDAEQERRRAAK
jgi:hypothetical protein